MKLDKETRQEIFDEAATCYEKVLQIRRKILDDPHPLLARSLYSMALIHGGRKELDQSAEMHIEALGMRRRVYGTDNHQEVLDSLNALAGVRKRQGLLKEAEYYYNDAFRKSIALSGPNHYGTKLYFSNLCQIFRLRGDRSGLEDLLEEFDGRLSPHLLATAEEELARIATSNGAQSATTSNQ